MRRKIGQAIASEARARHISTLAVGYDGRLSGPALNDALIRGIIAAGVNVVSIGMVPTPDCILQPYCWAQVPAS